MFVQETSSLYMLYLFIYANALLKNIIIEFICITNGIYWNLTLFNHWVHLHHRWYVLNVFNAAVIRFILVNDIIVSI